MVGGLVTPPLLLAGPAGANLGTDAQLYLVSACLIWCGVGTAIQVSRLKVYKTRYFIGTGLISVVGTSFAFTNVALSYLAQSYANGTCPMSEDGLTKLPCPKEFGAILGTSVATGVWAIALAFVPPRIIRKLFPPLITGCMLVFIGVSSYQIARHPLNRPQEQLWSNLVSPTGSADPGYAPVITPFDAPPATCLNIGARHSISVSGSRVSSLSLFARSSAQRLPSQRACSLA